MGVLLRLLSARPEAEEALQELYTRVWLRSGRYDPAKRRGMTWLIAIARNLAIDRLRSRPPRGTDEGLDPGADSAPRAFSRAIAKDEAGRLAGCFGQLAPDRADAVRAAYLSGLSYGELAARHAVPVTTLRIRLRHSLLQLRECMDQ